MAIKFREDPDLMFLSLCDDEDLEILVKILTGKDDDKRLTEELSSETRFKGCNNNYKQVWDLIAGELQLFGADSVISIFRGGKGVVYREILCDVCDKVDAKYEDNDDIQEMEQQLLLKIMEKSFEKMSDKERETFAEAAGLKVKDFGPQALMIALQAGVRMGGFASYQLAAVVANAVARAVTGSGLSLAANAGLMRGLAVFAGPIGWVISGLLTVPLISGPAYRVTVPACVQVAYMRNKYINKDFL